MEDLGPDLHAGERGKQSRAEENILVGHREQKKVGDAARFQNVNRDAGRLRVGQNSDFTAIHSSSAHFCSVGVPGATAPVPE